MGDENLFAKNGRGIDWELVELGRKFDEGIDYNALQEMLAREEENMKRFGVEYWELHPEAYVCPYEAPEPTNSETESERTKQEGNCSESTSGSVTGSDSSPSEKAQLKSSPKPETAPGKPQK